jgi:hypothetical protein
VAGRGGHHARGDRGTGECWRPVHIILEGGCEVWLLDAQRIEAVLGRKTDIAEAAWIA